jgi:hypothetical protein
MKIAYTGIISRPESISVASAVGSMLDFLAEGRWFKSWSALICVLFSAYCFLLLHSNVLLHYYEHFYYLENVNKSRTNAGSLPYMIILLTNLAAIVKSAPVPNVR